jgi:hypothetical protein
MSFLYGKRSAKFHLGDRVHLAEDKAVTEKGDFWRIVVTEHDCVPKRIGIEAWTKTQILKSKNLMLSEDGKGTVSSDETLKIQILARAAISRNIS